MDLVYLAGGGYQVGERYAIVRELRDPNRYEVFAGQHSAVKSAGFPYAELGDVEVLEVHDKIAIARIQYSCDAMVLGDVVAPFTPKPEMAARHTAKFERFPPHTESLSARIVMAKDFDSELGTGAKVYFTAGAEQGVRVGDYFRVVRPPETELEDPVDSLSFKASTADDTQRHPASLESNWFAVRRGPRIDVREFPRRAVGEVLVLGVTPTTATGMVVFALEDIHVGDTVEIDGEVALASGAAK
jgi:hypothetical protein